MTIQFSLFDERTELRDPRREAKASLHLPVCRSCAKFDWKVDGQQFYDGYYCLKCVGCGYKRIVCVRQFGLPDRISADTLLTERTTNQE